MSERRHNLVCRLRWVYDEGAALEESIRVEDDAPYDPTRLFQSDQNFTIACLYVSDGYD